MMNQSHNSNDTIHTTTAAATITTTTTSRYKDISQQQQQLLPMSIRKRRPSYLSLPKLGRPTIEKTLSLLSGDQITLETGDGTIDASPGKPVPIAQMKRQQQQDHGFVLQCRRPSHRRRVHFQMKVKGGEDNNDDDIEIATEIFHLNNYEEKGGSTIRGRDATERQSSVRSDIPALVHEPRDSRQRAHRKGLLIRQFYPTQVEALEELYTNFHTMGNNGNKRQPPPKHATNPEPHQHGPTTTATTIDVNDFRVICNWTQSKARGLEYSVSPVMRNSRRQAVQNVLAHQAYMRREHRRQQQQHQQRALVEVVPQQQYNDTDDTAINSNIHDAATEDDFDANEFSNFNNKNDSDKADCRHRRQAKRQRRMDEIESIEESLRRCSLAVTQRSQEFAVCIAMGDALSAYDFMLQ